MLWISELFSWDIFLCFEPCWNIFLDHELIDLFIDTWEAAIVYVRERVQCIGKFQVVRSL